MPGMANFYCRQSLLIFLSPLTLAFDVKDSIFELIQVKNNLIKSDSQSE